MLKRIGFLTSIFIFSLFTCSSAFASKYDTCLKWVVDALGAHCPSGPNKDIGTLLFFKQVGTDLWLYQSKKDAFPLEFTLPGPGLQGGRVTTYGKEACQKFCDTYGDQS
jgi:hypothetical protein